MIVTYENFLGNCYKTLEFYILFGQMRNYIFEFLNNILFILEILNSQQLALYIDNMFKEHCNIHKHT